MARARAKDKVQFGDFQTPDELARRVCSLLKSKHIAPESVVEPTCGKGAFLRACVDVFPESRFFLGYDINREYVREAKKIARANIHCEDFFKADWSGILDDLPEPILVIGNPPWVTNSTMGALGGDNLPIKSNSRRFKGLDAITGKSNFDISESMLGHLLERLSGRRALIAMLCKTTVARKVLSSAWVQGLHIKESAIYPIDSTEYFNASVDACLMTCVLEPGRVSTECISHPSLEECSEVSVFGLRDGKLVADMRAYDAYGHLSGTSSFKWRSGVKHDCARVMELQPLGHDQFKNGLGEVAELEPTYLYPMLKSSELANGSPTSSRYMLVTQKLIGEDTSQIKYNAPKTWDYLHAHADVLGKRASSIYRNRPPFSVFGVGPYSFSPWKVAISGFYKNIDFRAIGTMEGKPVVLDDTCYFIPCDTEQEAKDVACLLNSEPAREFFCSFIFWDGKRPITAKLLSELDIEKLAEAIRDTDPLLSDRVLIRMVAHANAEQLQLQLA